MTDADSGVDISAMSSMPISLPMSERSMVTGSFIATILIDLKSVAARGRFDETDSAEIY
jgi:hypothetical protein